MEPTFAIYDITMEQFEQLEDGDLNLDDVEPHLKASSYEKAREIEDDDIDTPTVLEEINNKNAPERVICETCDETIQTYSEDWLEYVREAHEIDSLFDEDMECSKA